MNKKTPKEHTIVQDETYQHMYRIVYPDGVLSEDMYSKAWAEENIRRLKDESSKPSAVSEVPSGNSLLKGKEVVL